MFFDLVTPDIAAAVLAGFTLLSQLASWARASRQRKWDLEDRERHRQELEAKLREENLKRAVLAMEHSQQIMQKLVEAVEINKSALAEANGTNTKIARLHEEFKQAVSQPKVIVAPVVEAPQSPNDRRGKITTGRKK